MSYLQLFSCLVVCILIVSPSSAAYPHDQESSYQYRYGQYETPTGHDLSDNLRYLGDDSVDAIPLELPLAPALESFSAQEAEQRDRFPPFNPHGPQHHHEGYPPFKGERHHEGYPPFKGERYHEGYPPFKGEKMNRGDGHRDGRHGKSQGRGFSADHPKLDLESTSSEEMQELLNQSLVNINEAITNIQPKDFWINSGKIGAILRYKKQAAEKLQSELHSSEEGVTVAARARRRLQYQNADDRSMNNNNYNPNNNHYNNNNGW